MTKKNYNFGEKKEEWHVKQGKTLPVWQSPKYIQSKDKAIELIEDGKFGLNESDFWILMNATKTGKMMYAGLIISHNGCLKINDRQEDNFKFKPNSVSFVKDEADKVKVMSYINQEQGVYEFGEISPKNCMNDYPYAMVLKRLMDRVILKNSKIGFFGIYSEAESDSFKESADEKPKDNNDDNTNKRLANAIDGDIEDTRNQANEETYEAIKSSLEMCHNSKDLDEIWKENQSDINALEKYKINLFQSLVKTGKTLREQFSK